MATVQDEDEGAYYVELEFEKWDESDIIELINKAKDFSFVDTIN